MGVVDYFGTFLETVEREQENPTAGAKVTRLLTTVSEAGDMAPADLLRVTGLPLGEFVQALQDCSEAGLIAVMRSPDGGELLTLTEQGHAMVAGLGLAT